MSTAPVIRSRRLRLLRDVHIHLNLIIVRARCIFGWSGLADRRVALDWRGLVGGALRVCDGRLFVRFGWSRLACRRVALNWCSLIGGAGPCGTTCHRALRVRDGRLFVSRAGSGFLARMRIRKAVSRQRTDRSRDKSANENSGHGRFSKLTRTVLYNAGKGLSSSGRPPVAERWRAFYRFRPCLHSLGIAFSSCGSSRWPGRH